MIYPYMTLADGTEIVHTQVFEEDGVQKVEVHFERPTTDGFDTARCQLPSYTWQIRDGFTEEEVEFFNKFMRSNAQLFYKYGSGGIVREIYPDEWDRSMIAEAQKINDGETMTLQEVEEMLRMEVSNE